MQEMKSLMLKITMGEDSQMICPPPPKQILAHIYRPIYIQYSIPTTMHYTTPLSSHKDSGGQERTFVCSFLRTTGLKRRLGNWEIKT